MKTALITTTINVPKVLALYRKLDPDTAIFIAGDEKTPDAAVRRFMQHIETGFEAQKQAVGAHYYSPERQKELGYDCSTALGWNNDSRRNIALLEALKWGAELIVSVDDDMIPNHTVPTLWFSDMMTYHFTGLQLGTPMAWFDAGQFTMPPAPQRGLPPDMYEGALSPEPVVNVKVGVMQGVILGVPDTDAMTAMANGPLITSATDILRKGFVVHPQAYSVFNSQFTAFRRELAPAFAQFYNYQGRNTDIFASMLMRRIMRDRDLYTYFGPPMAFHARSHRPLFKDLKAEIFGLETIHTWAEYLDRIPDCSDIVEQCSRAINGFGLFSDKMKETAEAWFRDVEKVF